MAYISTKEVAAIRGQLKEKFKGLKFSVRKHHHSSVTVTIKAGNVDFSDLLDDNGYAQTNQYWLNRMGKHEYLFEEIYKVIKTAPASVEGGREWFDDSDSMTDYFHTAFYMSVNIGSYDKPYVCSKPKAVKLPKKSTISDTAESIARMSNAERDKLVDDLIASYPNLADELLSKIGFGLMETENC